MSYLLSEVYFNVKLKPGVLFPPHYGGEVEISRLFPPIFRDPGGKSGFFPPSYYETQGGSFIISPSLWGGRARRRRKILRILTPEMLEILKKNAFQNVQITEKPQKFPACGGLFFPQQYFFYKNASQIPKKISPAASIFL